MRMNAEPNHKGYVRQGVGTDPVGAKGGAVSKHLSEVQFHDINHSLYAVFATKVATCSSTDGLLPLVAYVRTIALGIHHF